MIKNIVVRYIGRYLIKYFTFCFSRKCGKYIISYPAPWCDWNERTILHLLASRSHRYDKRGKSLGNICGRNISVAALSRLECFKRTTSPHLSRKWAACWDRSFRKGLVPSLSCKLHSIFSNLWQFVLTAPTCSHVPSAPVNARTRKRLRLRERWSSNKIHFTDALTHAGLFDIIFIPGFRSYRPV